MKASRFYLPTLGDRTEIEAELAGLRPELYRRMLREISAQLRLADDLGYDFGSAPPGADAAIERLWNEVMRGFVTRHPADSLDNLTHQTRRGRIA